MRTRASAFIPALISTALAALAAEAPSARAGGPDGGGNRVVDGRALFLREWIPGEPTPGGGDGLGPVYNDTSCVACHNQGGPGGAGGAGKNVHLVTATVTPVEGERGHVKDRFNEEFKAKLREIREKRAELHGRKLPEPRAPGAPPDRGQLIKLHPRFIDSSSIVVHRFGPKPGEHAGWRFSILNPEQADMVGMPGGIRTFLASPDVDILVTGVQFRPSTSPEEHGHFMLSASQRNPTALFGAGLLDTIPDEELEAAESRDREFPEIRGRLARLTDGRIGRFGWKGQAASLDDFVRLACAVELGLEVPGQSQGPDPGDPGHRAPGLDLDQAGCDALTAFVRSLPRPDERVPDGPAEAEAVRMGREAFGRIGCAECHRPRIGPVEGLYSDLMLHDMGGGLGDAGSYGFSSPEPSEEEPGSVKILAGSFPAGLDAFQGGTRIRPASSREWRTPPLWGLRDSAPYMHDGRAETIEEAIALHQGEGHDTTNRYFRLTTRERLQIQAFLKSLVAPDQSPPAGPNEVPDLPIPRRHVGLR